MDNSRVKGLIEKIVGISIRYRYWFSGIVAFGIAVLWVNSSLSIIWTIPIKQIRIEGVFVHSSLQNLQAMVRENLQDDLLTTDVRTLHKELLSLPWVAEVSVQRRWPDSLQIWIKEQTAVAYWGHAGFLNERGQYFVPEYLSVLPNLPVLYGPTGSELKVLKKYQIFQEGFQQYGLVISRLEMNPRQAWKLQLRSGTEIRLGEFKPDLKFNRFIDWIVVDKNFFLTDFQYIDMRYPDGFAVRKKDSTIAATKFVQLQN